MRNEDSEKRLEVENITEVQESKTGWFGHVKRRDQDYVGRKTLEMVPGEEKRGRTKQRWMERET